MHVTDNFISLALQLITLLTDNNWQYTILSIIIIIIDNILIYKKNLFTEVGTDRTPAVGAASQLRWAHAIKAWAYAIKVWANAIKMQDQHQKSTNIVLGS